MKTFLRYLVVVFWLTGAGAASTTVSGDDTFVAQEKTGDAVLDYARSVIRSHFSGLQVSSQEALKVDGNWTVTVVPYLNGIVLGTGTGKSRRLDQAVADAIEDLFSAPASSHPGEKDLSDARLQISFARSGAQPYALIEYRGRAEALIGDVVVIPRVDNDMIYSKTMDAKAYLFRAMDKRTHGFHKLYDARKGEQRPHHVFLLQPVQPSQIERSEAG